MEFIRDGIALHARRLTIEHPTQKTSLTFVAPLPVAWKRLGYAFPNRDEE
ncbi:MAG: hypothetical protein QM811_11115 [Pirellulales bacterium]